MKSVKWILFASMLLSGLIAAVAASSVAPTAVAQENSNKKKQIGTVRQMTIPVGIKVRKYEGPEIQLLDLNVSEDGEPQSILSIRAISTNSPISLAVLIQDDLVTS